MNYLAIDYWIRKTWLAVSFENIAFPLKIVDTSKLIDEVAKIINEREIKIIVIWIARFIDWKESIQSKKTKQFAKILKSKIANNVKIVFEDERYSTYEAINSMENIWVKKYDWKKLDDIAATIILQSYLDKTKNL